MTRESSVEHGPREARASATPFIMPSCTGRREQRAAEPVAVAGFALFTAVPAVGDTYGRNRSPVPTLGHDLGESVAVLER